MTPAIVIAGTLAIITVACFVAMTLTYIFEVRREDRLDDEERARRERLVTAFDGERPMRWTGGLIGEGIHDEPIKPLYRPDAS